MLLPPESVIASWPTPNFVDPVVRGNAVVLMNLIFYPILLTVIVLRSVTRCFISRSFGLDDYLIIAALFPTTAFAAVALLSERHFELNRHVWDVPLANLIIGRQLILSSQIIFTVAQTLTKLSMLSLIYRIMSSASRRLQSLTIWIMIWVTLGGSIFIAIVIFQCRPISAYWTLSTTPQKCINEPVHVLIASILNTLNDFVVVAFPIPTVYKLQLPRRQQVVVMLLFGGGFVVCIAGGARTVFTHRMVTSWDESWDSYPNWVSSSAELYIGIICASVPATKPFFQRFIPQLINSASRSRLTFSTKGRSNSSAARSRTSNLADVELGNYQSPLKRFSEYLGDTQRASKMRIIHEESEVPRESETSISSFNVAGGEYYRPRVPEGRQRQEAPLSMSSTATMDTLEIMRVDSVQSRSQLIRPMSGMF
ncbi:hypothetical protein BP5796_02962 [Coleophoma crateriformis]|uniref:Rhodopsin domain-containing protein n=1 Tax=Coleophoma crateriformis TaxID=565419 RepID=A0A3D8SNA2_9HELO|nr:hypothetical protein BP5796_02962 [Coleophoma crateriformis]